MFGFVIGYLEFFENEYNNLVEEVLELNNKIFNFVVYIFDGFKWVFGILRFWIFFFLIGEDIVLVLIVDLVNYGKGFGDGFLSWVRKGIS